MNHTWTWRVLSDAQIEPIREAALTHIERSGGQDRPPDANAVYPEAEELELAAVGGRRRAKADVKTPPVKVSVTRGDLAYARHLVAVGHYEGASRRISLGRTSNLTTMTRGR